MAKKLFLLLIAAAFIFSVNINAQESKKKNKDKDNDEENFWSNWGKSKWLDWRLRGNPFIELDYGFLQP